MFAADAPPPPIVADAAALPANAARFDWFEYKGTDPWSANVGESQFLNPILAGFYPDPSITRVDDDYYLVNSTFAYWPGVPIFHSRDLVNWTQLGHVFDRPSQMNLDGLGVSRGIFAPAIEHHDGVFYLITTLVDAGGNVLVTARDPAGPWSEPIWLLFEGIDPSLFFDDDGRAWVVNNGAPEGEPLYEGHRAIWIQEFDIAAQKMIGPRRVLVNGGVDLREKPVWIEGPHIFKRDGWYYLNCAEGGTAENHRQVIFRSRTITGTYEPWGKNPTLTQRDLPADRANPVTSTGHADFVQTPGGEWWAVFLGCRPYADNHYNTGRETFLLPVTWTDDGWPMVLKPGEAVPAIERRPDLPAQARAPVPLTGTFTWRDEFDRPALGAPWVLLRTPRERWLSLTTQPGSLLLVPRSVTLSSREQPSYVGRRVQHAGFEASTAVALPTSAKDAAAGLAVFQNEEHFFTLMVQGRSDGREIVLAKAANGAPQEQTRATLPEWLGGAVELRVVANGASYEFYYAIKPGEWRRVGEPQDGRNLSTKTAGGFVGATVGMYAVQR